MSATSDNLDNLRAKASSGLGTIKRSAEDMKDSALAAKDQAADDLSDLMDSAKKSGKAELAAAADRLSGYLSSIGESAAELTQRGKESAQAAFDTTDTYVKDHPWQSVAIGAGVGALLGFAIGMMATRR